MEYRTLRGTGATVSRVSLGTMTFGQQTDEATAMRMVDMAMDAGVNSIDTADVYVNGVSEKIVGKALKGKRDRVVLASKVANFVGQDKMRDSGLHRWHVIRGVEASLKRLGTDCLDICYLHTPDKRTPIEETLSAFDLLARQGKVIYIGMSNYTAWQVCEALWKCDVRQWAAPVVIQVPYNIITRSIDEECVSFCDRMNIGIAVYNPVAGGLLTGKHARDKEPAKGTRFELNQGYYGRCRHERNFDAVDELREIARDAGKSLTELAMQWVASQSHVDSIIIGASKIEHLEENLKAADGKLDEAALKACDTVWEKIRGNHFRYFR